MPIEKPKNSLVIFVLLLTACTGNPSVRTSNSVPKTPDSITKPITQPFSPPTPKVIYPWEFQVDLQKIDPELQEHVGKVKIVYNKESDKSPNGKCYYEAIYPQISGIKDIGLQEELNHKLWVKITSKAHKGFEQNLKDGSCASNRNVNYSYILRITNCQTKFAREALVSIVCQERHSPGAYPLIYQIGATFNLKTGKMYSIDDLWKPEVNYDLDIEPFLYRIKKEKDTDGTERIREISAALGKAKYVYLRTNGDFYLAERCENRENTIPPFITPPDLSKITCIIFVKTGSGLERNLNLIITTKEIDKFLNPEIAEVIAVFN
jgi:hypothetical protein